MFISLAPPRILFSMYSSHLIQRVNIDGENLMTVYSASYPRALDYDIQLDIVTQFICILLYPLLIILCRRGYVFWVNFNSDRIVRGQGIETPSTYTELVTSDISCVGTYNCSFYYMYIVPIIARVSIMHDIVNV